MSKTMKKVTKKFLLKLADSIYNPETKEHLRMCAGNLQEDPEESGGKPLHCGLGELYFAMSGRQPRSDSQWLTEDDVIDLAISQSPIEKGSKIAIKKAVAGIKSLDLPPNVQNDAIEAVTLQAEEFGELAFRTLLEQIPEENDEADSYVARARRVAKILRKAAELLP